MGAATVTSTEYGYTVSGDTGAATVSTGRIWVKAMAAALDDDDDTAVLTTNVAGTDTSVFKFKANGNDDDAGMEYVYFGEKGIPMSGLKVTLNDAQSVLYIYLA
jgi:hypothetical protein